MYIQWIFKVKSLKFSCNGNISFTYSLFARWFQSELISHGIIFFSYTKPAPVNLSAQKPISILGYTSVVVVVVVEVEHSTTYCILLLRRELSPCRTG